MTTEADLEGLVANALDVDSCPFVFAEASHARETDSLGALATAIAYVDTHAPDPDPDYDVGGEAPYLSPAGPASRLGGNMGEDDRVAQWFVQLASALTEMGWSGALRPLRWEDRPEYRPDAAIWVAVTLCFAGWVDRAHQVVVPPWDVDPTRVPDVVDLMMEWTSGIDGDLWFTRHGSVRGAEPDVRRALEARLAEGSRPFAAVHRQGTSAERRATLSMWGHVMLEERSTLTLGDRLATLRSATLPWASRLDHSFTTSERGGGLNGWTVEQGRGELNRSYYPHGRHLDDHRVPDACVEQVLTGKHLAAANDLSHWQVDEVAKDRYLVSHPHPSDWFLPTPPDQRQWPDSNPETHVDPQTLTQAREDFGAMILQDSDL